MKRIILLVIASVIIYGCAKDMAVNVVSKAVSKQAAALSSI